MPLYLNPILERIRCVLLPGSISQNSVRSTLNLNSSSILHLSPILLPRYTTFTSMHLCCVKIKHPSTSIQLHLVLNSDHLYLLSSIYFHPSTFIHLLSSSNFLQQFPSATSFSNFLQQLPPSTSSEDEPQGQESDNPSQAEQVQGNASQGMEPRRRPEPIDECFPPIPRRDRAERPWPALCVGIGFPAKRPMGHQ